MLITLYIDYHASWGERLAVTGSLKVLGSGNECDALPLECLSESTWHVTFDVPDHIDEFDYSYVVTSDDGSIVRREYGQHARRVTKTGNIGHMTRMDAWRQMPADKPMTSSAFTRCFFKRKSPVAPDPACAGNIRLEVLAPEIEPEYVLAVSGSTDVLGNWDPARALRMADGDFPRWYAHFSPQQGTARIEYKFLVLDAATGALVGWEDHDNRVLDIDCDLSVSDRYMAIDCGAPSMPLPKWRGAGVAIPLFSIRAEADFGVGDFNGLMRMVDWCAETGMDFLQLLPINDTTMTGSWRDSYPYNANSTYAIHPIYLHLEWVGTLSEPARREHYARIARELNGLSVLDYERVSEVKDLYARELYAQAEPSLESDRDYCDFINRNAMWLTPYAAFRLLCSRFGTPDMSRWGKYATYDAVEVAHLAAEHHREIHYHYFVQYHLDRQLRRVRDYAATRGVALKGDIPIGISRTSVDAWQYPQLYNLGCQAGAPPDFFATEGQNWGFPTYNWDAMARDGYAWWKDRFAKMGQYFDAFRIDHLLGFFRIWEIPMRAVHGLLGYFNPALPFSPDELSAGYGFNIDLSWQTRPYITEDVLKSVFGEKLAQVVREHYLYTDDMDASLRLRSEVDTQRKVIEVFSDQFSDDPLSRQIASGLLTLIDGVLFIEDPYRKGHYHPRIAAQGTPAYMALDPESKAAYDRLYFDFFYRRHNDFWRCKAMEKLPALSSATEMLVCAEDLGMIPDCVPSVMEELQILSLEVQRMPKSPDEEFGRPCTYPYLSVCTTSTHDMPGIRQWWETDHDATQRYYNHILNLPGEAPTLAEPWICSRIVEQHLESPSMLCIIPLQDWLATDGDLRRPDPREEVINNPADPNHYWRYRMHLTVEKLLKSADFNASLRGLVNASGR